MQISRMIKILVWKIFPPDSSVERYFRSQYHRLTSNKWYIQWEIEESKRSYLKWLHYQKKELDTLRHSFPPEPLISFWLVLNSSELEESLVTIHSIKAQRSQNWELILLVPENDPISSDIKELMKQNNQIVLFERTEICIKTFVELSKGDYFVCCSPGDQFDSDLLDQVNQTIHTTSEAEIIYTDVDERPQLDKTPIPFFKPSKYSPELHLSINYLSRSIIKKSKGITRLSQVDPAMEIVHQEWEWLFLLCEEGAQLAHIPYVLVHQLHPRAENMDQVKALLSRHLTRTGIQSPIEINLLPNVQIRWQFQQPSISIIIPTKNNLRVIRNLITSVFERTNYDAFEIVLVDNGSDDKEIFPYYSEIKRKYPVRVVEYNEPFNYSKANNLGASASKSDLLLFMNNDMEIIHSDWLTELAQWASLPQIGIVGTKLLHEDNTIQHAGVVLGLQGFVGHLYLNTPDHYNGLIGSVDWYRDVSAVTGACQMIRRQVFEELNGFDETFQLVFSDVDICLRAIAEGYRILYTPNAALKHLEGSSRGYNSPPQDILRGYDLFHDWIFKDDPYFSPNLTYTTIPRCSTGKKDFNQRLNMINERKKYLLADFREKNY